MPDEPEKATTVTPALMPSGLSNQVLNEDQQAAVYQTDGYVRVIAGPGTGKTRVLSNRYAYICQTLGILPEHIMSVTFTNKAAAEMKRRIRDLTNQEDGRWIGTFHGICKKILSYDIHLLHYPSTFQIIDEEDQKALLRDIFEENHVTMGQHTYHSILDGINLFKLNYRSYVPIMTAPDTNAGYFPQLDANDHLSANFIILQYLIAQRKNYYLDFSDLINFVLYLLETNNAFREKWQDHFQYIQVDEAQDINLRQEKLVSILSEKHKNLFLVGDPDQAIYGFRGGGAEFLLGFDKIFPTAQTIVLRKTYRSLSPILDASYTLIRHNENRIDQMPATIRGGGPNVRFFHAKTKKQEVDWIVAQIKQIRDSGESLSHIAILYRANNNSRRIEEGLIEHQIPYVMWSGFSFYQRAEIKDALSYLRLTIADDDLAFSRAIATPRRGLGKKRIAVIKELAKSQQISLYQALKQSLNHPLIRTTGAGAFVELIESGRRMIREKNILDLLDFLLKESGYEKQLMLDGDQERLDNIEELKDSMRSALETAGEEVTPEEYLNSIALYTSLDRKESEDTVKLSTVHRSKGLEFRYVFVPFLNEGVFPSYRIRSKKEMEEERRVAFVALTRAENGLFLSNSEEDVQGAPPLMMSRFVLEMDLKRLNCSGEISQEYLKTSEEYIIQMKAKEERPAQQLGEPAAQEAFRPGQAVLHPAFGRGKIRNITQDAYLVDFESGKSRSIAKTYPLKSCPSPDGKAETAGK